MYASMYVYTSNMSNVLIFYRIGHQVDYLPCSVVPWTNVRLALKPSIHWKRFVTILDFVENCFC